jgi:hypothetical protein
MSAQKLVQINVQETLLRIISQQVNLANILYEKGIISDPQEVLQVRPEIMARIEQELAAKKESTWEQHKIDNPMDAEILSKFEKYIRFKL